MDLLTFLITALPEPWAMRLAFVVAFASLLDLVLPAADPPSRWAIPRGVVHVLALNRQAAQDKLARWRRTAAP